MLVNITYSDLWITLLRWTLGRCGSMGRSGIDCLRI